MPTTEFYNRYYAAVESSIAHGKFCAMVYGKNMCQHGMADMSQIDTLIHALGVKRTDRLLDLGCGNGFITEYLQEVTGALVTGIDLSSVAIERACQRTAKRSDKITFQAADMRQLKYPAGSFEEIVLIDSHYFVNDVEGLLRKLMVLLSQDGKIGLFSDQGTGIPGRDDTYLKAGESKIGQFLVREGIHYDAVNLTEQNRAHWKLKQSVLVQLREEFEREDNLFLYENRMNECTDTNRDLDCRFLFIIYKKPRNHITGG
jgi:cyclopropane fatty-acyl-phospholipid synthase-like methyltransferase